MPSGKTSLSPWREPFSAAAVRPNALWAKGDGQKNKEVGEKRKALASTLKERLDENSSVWASTLNEALDEKS